MPERNIIRKLKTNLTKLKANVRTEINEIKTQLITKVLRWTNNKTEIRALR